MNQFLVHGIGMQAGADVAGAAAYRMDARACRFLVIPAAADGLIAVGFEVADAQCLQTLAATLSQRGFKVEAGTGVDCRCRAVDAFFRFTDPAGHCVEVCATAREDRLPFVSPTGSAFVTDPHGMGHVVMSAYPFAACESFYVDVLAFRRSDVLEVGGMAVSFLHCNQRHHSLALADIGGVPRVLHCMVEMQTLDAVGYALDRMMKLGFPIYRLLGRHGNDRMVSFYVDGPGGLQMEVGWGGLLIDGAGWCVGRIAVPSAWGHHTMPLPQVLPGSTPA